MCMNLSIDIHSPLIGTFLEKIGGVSEADVSNATVRVLSLASPQVHRDFRSACLYLIQTLSQLVTNMTYFAHVMMITRIVT